MCECVPARKLQYRLSAASQKDGAVLAQVCAANTSRGGGAAVSRAAEAAAAAARAPVAVLGGQCTRCVHVNIRS